MEKKKRIARKIRKAYTIKTNIKELSEILAELFESIEVDEFNILTYKDRLEIYACKPMSLIQVELYENFFSLADADEVNEDEIKKRNDEIEAYKKRTK